MAPQLYLISFIAIIATISGVESQKNKGSSCTNDGKTYQVRIIAERYIINTLIPHLLLRLGSHTMMTIVTFSRVKNPRRKLNS